jgi:hypothetical protein
MLTLIVILIVALEPIILLLGVWFLLKKYYKPTQPSIKVDVSGRNVTPETIRDGVKSAFQEMEQEKEYQKERKNKIKFSERVYSSTESGVTVNNTGGDLVPFNLSDNDKELLNMFYNAD